MEGSNPQEIFDETLSSGFDILHLDEKLLVTYFRLPPKERHKDPFNRMLIWQAINSNMILLTHDSKITTYTGEGLIIETG